MQFCDFFEAAAKIEEAAKIIPNSVELTQAKNIFITKERKFLISKYSSEKNNLIKLENWSDAINSLNKIKNDLYELTLKYPIVIQNDQAIIALYFVCIDKKWEDLIKEDDKQYFYDYKPNKKGKPYIMHKWR